MALVLEDCCLIHRIDGRFQDMKRISAILLLLMTAFLLSGCLVTSSSTSLSVENEREKEVKAEEVTVDFFTHNQVDTTSNDINYSADKLIDLFKEKNTGNSVTIDPIIGPKYDKSYDKLKEELNTQETLFEAQQEYNYKLLFKNPEGEKSYKVLASQGDYTNYTGTYDAVFQVFEEIDGKRILTDNGIITFEVDYQGTEEPLINHVLVDYRELGSIDLSDY